MGHAYLVANGVEEAEVLGVMASGDEELMQSLLDIHAEQRARSEPNAPHRRGSRSR